MTQVLKVSEIKKGDTIFVVGSYNHHYGMKRQQQHHRDEKGRSVYTEHTVDTYNIQKWTVFAVGKKIMRLIDDAGRMKTGHYRIKDNGTFGYVLPTQESAESFAKELHEQDPFKIENFKIEYNNLYW